MKKTFGKTLAMILSALMLLLSLAGCGSTSETTEESAAVPTETTKENPAVKTETTETTEATEGQRPEGTPPGDPPEGFGGGPGGTPPGDPLRRRSERSDLCQRQLR